MSLGRLEKIDLRTYWKKEATDFTPWLAKEENIQLLSETIGIELEVQLYKPLITWTYLLKWLCNNCLFFRLNFV